MACGACNRNKTPLKTERKPVAAVAPTPPPQPFGSKKLVAKMVARSVKMQSFNDLERHRI